MWHVPVVWVLDVVDRAGNTFSYHLSGPEPYGRYWKHYGVFRSHEHWLRHGDYASVELKAVRVGYDGTERESLAFYKAGRAW